MFQIETFDLSLVLPKQFCDLRLPIPKALDDATTNFINVDTRLGGSHSCCVSDMWVSNAYSNIP